MVYLILIRGPGGTGKSTVAKEVRKSLKEKTAILCPDIFYWDVCGKDENSQLVYEALSRLTDLYLSQGYNVILEGILASKTESDDLRIKGLLDIGKKYNARIKLFYLIASLDTAINRDKERGSIMGEDDTKKHYHHSLKSRHKDDIEIDTEKKTSKEVAEFIVGCL